MNLTSQAQYGYAASRFPHTPVVTVPVPQHSERSPEHFNPRQIHPCAQHNYIPELLDEVSLQFHGQAHSSNSNDSHHNWTEHWTYSWMVMRFWYAFSNYNCAAWWTWVPGTIPERVGGTSSFLHCLALYGMYKEVLIEKTAVSGSAEFKGLQGLDRLWNKPISGYQAMTISFRSKRPKLPIKDKIFCHKNLALAHNFAVDNEPCGCEVTNDFSSFINEVVDP